MSESIKKTRERAWCAAAKHNVTVAARVRKEARRRALLFGEFQYELEDLEEAAQRGMLPLAFGVGEGYLDPLKEADKAERALVLDQRPRK